MSKKKHKPTFNEMLADLKKSTSKIPEGESKECNIDAAIQKEIPAVQVPKIEEKNNPSNQLFRWVFLPEVLRDRNDEFGFGKYKKNGHQFLNEIEVKIYTKYADKTWGDISTLPHCGPYGKKSLSRNQKRKLHCSFKKYFSDENIQKEIQEQLFHISLSYSHRLFGFCYNSIFYIVLNDENHKFDSL